MKSLFNLKFFQSDLFRNGVWGIVANVLQTIFVSAFFVILARNFSREDFAEFLVASTIYQIIVAFSSMGLGQWFIREYALTQDKSNLTNKFIKIQTSLGLVFYFVNIVLSFVVYPDGQTRLLCIILGSNIIFDNIIYAIKNLNIADFSQKRTFIVLSIDGFLRVVLGCVLIVFPFSVVVMSSMLIVLRFLTANLFLRMASDNSISLWDVFQTPVSWHDVKTQLLRNWQFVVIGSVTIVYWRTANVIIAKVLTLHDVANYEISFRILSILMILPSVASATIYAQFIKLFNTKGIADQVRFYNMLFLIYVLYSFLSYGMIFLFSDLILPNIFGAGYADATDVLRQMFLTMLIFPTVLLQANIIVAMKYEKVDMWLNITSLAVYLLGCLIGFYFQRSILVINISIFVSFLIFHVLQNVFLISKKIVSWKEAVAFYIILAVLVYAFQSGGLTYNRYVTGVLFLIGSLSVFGYLFVRSQKSNRRISEEVLEVSIL